MKKYIRNVLKSLIAIILTILTTSCSLDESITLIELQVNYNNDVGEIYYNPIHEEHIVTTESGLRYIDNEILLAVDLNTGLNEVQEMVTKYNGQVVGRIEKTGDYQIMFNGVSSEIQLNDLIEKILLEDNVISAYMNYVIECSEDKINVGNKWKKI